MNISIRLSAGLAYAAGQTRLNLTLADSATVADAISAIVTQHPSLTGRLASAIPFVAGQQVGQSHPLCDGQELALLSPAAGGENLKYLSSRNSVTQLP